MFELLWQVPLGLVFLWAVVRLWRWALQSTPPPRARGAQTFTDRPRERLIPDFVVAVRLSGGMADGEEVEIPSERWLSVEWPALHARVQDNATVPPTVHHLLYLADSEDPRLFLFAGILPAAHEMMGDD